MAAKRSTATRVTALAGVLLALLALAGPGHRAGAAQTSEVTIYFVAFGCEEEPGDPYAECDILSGATYQIEADGTELAGSPFTTGPTSLVPGFTFDAPDDATLTVTQLSVDPPGYAPAPGFDPLVIDVVELPEVGCGGEATCPGIEFINFPFAIADGPADEEEPGGDLTLPTTGSGQPAGNSNQDHAIFVGLALFALALAMRVRRTGRKERSAGG